VRQGDGWSTLTGVNTIAAIAHHARGVEMGDIVGEVGTKKLFENDRVIVWEMRLEPGEKELVHEHKNDYLMVQIAGDRVAADFEPGCKGTWTEFAGQRLEGDVFNGNVLFADKGGIEAAVNVGNETFYEIIVELKDGTALPG
jgi:hypothetical protein